MKNVCPFYTVLEVLRVLLLTKIYKIPGLTLENKGMHVVQQEKGKEIEIGTNMNFSLQIFQI